MENKTSNIRTKLVYPQGLLICPVCQKEFEANDDTRYIIAGGYTCSWKCFLAETKRRRLAKEAEESQKRKEKITIKNT